MKVLQIRGGLNVQTGKKEPNFLHVTTSTMVSGRTYNPVIGNVMVEN